MKIRSTDSCPHSPPQFNLDIKGFLTSGCNLYAAGLIHISHYFPPARSDTFKASNDNDTL